MACSYDSACGKYVSDWRIEENGKLTFHIEIPFGCEAEVQLPEQEQKLLTAGNYDFTIVPKKNYRALYRETTPYEQLFADERAVEVLRKYVPDIYHGTDRKDVEAMSKSLADSRFRAMLFRQPYQQFDRAIEEICAILA